VRALAVEQTQGAENPDDRHDAENDTRQLGQKALLAHRESLRFHLRFLEAANRGLCFSFSIEVMFFASLDN